MLRIHPRTVAGGFAALVAIAAFAQSPALDRPAVFNVRDFGARGDGSADTAALQAAIDAAGRAGGGTVRVPAGQYGSGALELRSGVTLELAAGATVIASANPDDYARSWELVHHRSLLVACNVHDVAIRGAGTFRGRGEADLNRRADPEREDLVPKIRYNLAALRDCTGVSLQGIRFAFSEAHTLLLERCAQVAIRGIVIANNYWRTNTDGIDLESCHHATIEDCRIVAGDDGICLKTKNGLPCEDITVRDCVLESVASAFKLGTGSSGDFRNITLSDCTIRNSGVGIGIFLQDGGTAERIRFERTAIETTRLATPINSRLRNNVYPIYLDLDQRTADSRIGIIRDIAFSDLRIDSANGIYLGGLPGHPLRDLSLTRVAFHGGEGFDYSGRTLRSGHVGGTSRASEAERFVREPTCLAAAYVDGLQLDDFAVSIDPAVMQRFPRSQFALFHVESATCRAGVSVPEPR